jgi:hypothetical protein
MVVLGEAGNGTEAVDLVRQRHPDVVLMDIRMPVLDGRAKQPDDLRHQGIGNRDPVQDHGTDQGRDGDISVSGVSDEGLRRRHLRRRFAHRVNRIRSDHARSHANWST